MLQEQGSCLPSSNFLLLPYHCAQWMLRIVRLKRRANSCFPIKLLFESNQFIAPYSLPVQSWRCTNDLIHVISLTKLGMFRVLYFYTLFYRRFQAPYGLTLAECMIVAFSTTKRYEMNERQTKVNHNKEWIKFQYKYYYESMIPFETTTVIIAF